MRGGLAVYVVIGMQPLGTRRSNEVIGRRGLPNNRYLRYWIFRHEHFPAETLIASLADAIDAAGVKNGDRAAGRLPCPALPPTAARESIQSPGESRCGGDWISFAAPEVGIELPKRALQGAIEDGAGRQPPTLIS